MSNESTIIFSSFLTALLILLFLPLRIHSLCSNLNKTCYHSGSFNEELCKCDCFPSYQGEQCEYENCKYQPLSCLTDFSIASCKQSVIANYCPLMCQMPICKCGFDSCLNGGQFASPICSCICPNQFTGRRCDIFLTTTSTYSCALKLSCLNGAKQNPITCKCECKG